MSKRNVYNVCVKTGLIFTYFILSTSFVWSFDGQSQCVNQQERVGVNLSTLSLVDEDVSTNLELRRLQDSIIKSFDDSFVCPEVKYTYVFNGAVPQMNVVTQDLFGYTAADMTGNNHVFVEQKIKNQLFFDYGSCEYVHMIKSGDRNAFEQIFKDMTFLGRHTYSLESNEVSITNIYQEIDSSITITPGVIWKYFLVDYTGKIEYIHTGDVSQTILSESFLDTCVEYQCNANPNKEEDVDNDGQKNNALTETDIDNDGKENSNHEVEKDTDGDGILNEFDLDVDCDGLWNGHPAEDDIDGDGEKDEEDDDSDGDAKDNEEDDDSDDNDNGEDDSGDEDGENGDDGENGEGGEDDEGGEDSDGDGVPDDQEREDGTDPNDPDDSKPPSDPGDEDGGEDGSGKQGGGGGGLRVEIPFDNSNNDIVSDGEVIQSDAQDFSFTNFIKLLNVYLWIVVVGVLMVMIIFAGFLLITARGDPEKLKQANQTLVHAGIGFGIALVSYAIVQVVVNLF